MEWFKDLWRQWRQEDLIEGLVDEIRDLLLEIRKLRSNKGGTDD